MGMRLRSKILIGLMPLLVMPLLLVGWLAYTQLRQQSEATALRLADVLMGQVATSTQHHLRGVQADLTHFAASDLLRNYLAVKDAATRYEILQAPLLSQFATYLAAHPEYSEIRILLPDGTEDACLAAGGVSKSRKSEADAAWFRVVATGHADISVHFQSDPQTGELTLLFVRKLWAGDPGRGVAPSPERTLKGYLLVRLRSDFLRQQMQAEMAGGTGLLIFADNDGRILLHPALERVGQPLPPGIRARFSAGDGQRWQLSRELGSASYIKAQRIDERLWVVMLLPVADLLAASHMVGLQVVAVTLATVLFLSVILFSGLQRMFLRPFERLVAAAGEVGRGNLGVQLEVGGEDEVATLATTFNQMVKDLCSTQAQLLSHQEVLEKTVQERTLHLQATIKELNEALRVAEEAGRLRDQFLANVSHELRTPLNGIFGMAQLLLTTDLTPRQRDYVKTVLASGDSLLAVIDNILDFAQIDSGRLQLASVALQPRELVAEVVGIFEPQARSKGLELTSEVAGEVPAMVHGDPLRLRQVLANLLDNAIKFTPQGRVAIEVALLATAGKRVRLGFRVSDTGVGIPQEALERLFQSFFQVDGSYSRRHGGLGLGLAIARQLVILMGGTMGVMSQEGQGSTFTVEIPFPLATASGGDTAPEGEDGAPIS